MVITQPGHGHWLVRCLVAALLPLAAGTVAPAQDGVDSGVIRGQSPIGFSKYSQSVQSDRTLPFTAAAPPWIGVSQDSAAPPPAFSVGPQIIMSQEPHDPASQGPITGGVPGYVDPSLAWGFMNLPPIWQPYFSAQGKFGNHGSLGFGQLMIPLYQDGQSLIFADLRGRFDDSSNTEGNFGIAMRTLVDPTWFFGLYGFYDYKRTEFGNSFQQATFGVEALSVDFEARVNGYIPESGAKHANQITDAQFDNGTIFVRGGFERAYYGVDGEVGALLAEQYGGNLELRGFVGGYYFDTTASGFPVVAGPKGRLELRAYDVSWFGPESRLNVGIELQHDNVRDTQVAGLVRLEIPLSMFGGARRLNRLERRMLDQIVRDDDIITVARKSPREPGRDSTGQLLMDNVTLVNSESDIRSAAMMAPQYSTVVVDGTKGVIQSNNILLREGQVLRGGGFQVIGRDTGATTTFGTRPTIENTNPSMATVILDNYAKVTDLNLKGGSTGIYGSNLTGVLVSGNQVSGAAGDGIRFDGTLTNSNVSGNQIRMAAGDGIHFDGTLTNSIVSGNTANENLQSGIYFADLAGGTVSGNTATGNNIGIGVENMAGGTVSGNTANNNRQYGLGFGSVAGGKVSGNTANNNGQYGLGFGSVAGGAVDGNTANNNGLHGFIFTTGSVAGIVSRNTAANNTGNGFQFNPDAIVSGLISENRANNNFGAGFQFNSTVNGMISGNTANNNALGGFQFHGEMIGIVSENSAIANGFSSNALMNDPNANGFSLFANDGTFTDNIATGNANNGFFLTNGNNLSGIFTRNTATRNINNGFLLNANDGTFTDNIANQNGDKGYRGTNTGTAVNNSGVGNQFGEDTFNFIP